MRGKSADGQRAQRLGRIYGGPDARGGYTGKNRLMSVSSYGSGTKTSGVVKIVKDLDMNLEGYDLLLVEDILDSGKTLFYLREILQKRNPASIRIATLLNKPARREADIVPDYSCFEVPDEFVVGYGWTMRKNTATCRISGYSNQKYILSNLKSDPGRILG